MAACQEAVHNGKRLLIRGGGSKTALSGPLPGVTVLEMGGLAGILDYDPGEYTFTAFAGTAVADIEAALAENGQYLPFEPLLAGQGATLGGTIAANMSGSGRFRYGGVRDFILSAQFIDGRGRLLRGGAKVVKNSAGFDLPKFFVGSLGRYGVLVEVSFKVFPQPQTYATLQLSYPQLEAAMQAIFSLAQRSFEMDALDLLPEEDEGVSLLLRIGGLAESLPVRLDRLRLFLQAETAVSRMEEAADDGRLWQAARALAWVDTSSFVVKVPVPPRLLTQLDALVRPLASRRRYTSGGNVAWLAVSDLDRLHEDLQSLSLAGLVVKGESGRVYVGRRQGVSLAQKIKQALDPAQTFLPDANRE